MSSSTCRDKGDKRKKGRWRKRFLEALQEQGCVTVACRLAKVGRATVYRLRKEDPGFAAEWDEAVETMVEGVEDSVLHRARYGWEEPVFYQGKQVGTVRKYSTTLQIARAGSAHRAARH